MHDLDALIAAIRAAPDDDTVRLAAADWLDENRRPEWAEFVRVQIELTRMLDASIPRTDEYDARFEYLFSRERELLQGPLRLTFESILFGANGDITCRADLTGVARGFLECVDCETPWWIYYGDDTILSSPILAVGLRTVPRYWILSRGPGSVLGGPALPTEEIEDGVRLDGDWRAVLLDSYDVLREQRPGERIEAAMCRLRWPGIRFEFLSDTVLPPAAHGSQPPKGPPGRR